MEGILNEPYQRVSLHTLKELIKKSVSQGKNPTESLQAIDGASSVQQLAAHLLSLGEANTLDEVIVWFNQLVDPLWRKPMFSEVRPSSVLTIEDFLKKYGYHTFTAVLGEFIKLAPPFPREQELAGTLGYMVADLETALKEFSQRNRK